MIQTILNFYYEGLYAYDIFILHLFYKNAMSLTFSGPYSMRARHKGVENYDSVSRFNEIQFDSSTIQLNASATMGAN